MMKANRMRVIYVHERTYVVHTVEREAGCTDKFLLRGFRLLTGSEEEGRGFQRVI